MSFRASVLAIVVLAGSVWSTDVLWAGLTLERVPTFEKEFDRLMREDLQVNLDVQMIDNEAASRLRQKIDFDEFSAISRKLVEKVMHYIPDSTMIVWGRITDYSLVPRRCGFLWMGARIQGTLTIALNIYSLRFQRYAYAGDVTIEAEIPKGVIWFYPLDVSVHISAEDRAAIMGKLQHDAAQRCASLVAAVIRSENDRQEKIADIQGLQRYEEPSVKDLFSIPSVEAKQLEAKADTSAKRDTAAAKSAAADTSKPKAAVGSAATDTARAAAKQPGDTAAVKKPDSTKKQK